MLALTAAYRLARRRRMGQGPAPAAGHRRYRWSGRRGAPSSRPGRGLYRWGRGNRRNS